MLALCNQFGRQGEGIKTPRLETETVRQELELGVLDNHVKVIVFNQVVELLR